MRKPGPRHLPPVTLGPSVTGGGGHGLGGPTALALGALGLGAGLGLGYGLAFARVQVQAQLYPRYWRNHPDAPGLPTTSPRRHLRTLSGAKASASADSADDAGAGAGVEEDGRGPLRIHVIGDSAASGVGAPHPRLGYVGLLERRLSALTGRAIRTENLAVPGASSWLLMELQLPAFEALTANNGPADLNLCVIGANDIVGREFTHDGFIWTAERLYPRLPAGTVVSTIPSFGIERVNARVRPVNEVIRDLAATHDLELADLHGATSALGLRRYLARTGGDLFHPNAAGYRFWAAALWPAVRRAYLRGTMS